MPVNPKSLKNLMPPVQKGEVRNPKGRKKGSLNAKTIIQKWLNVQRVTADPFAKPLTAKEVAAGKKMPKVKLSELDIIVIAQIGKARKGDTWAFNSLIDRTEGKPNQPNQFLGADGEPIDPKATFTIEL